jgi:hypothetical protein
MKQEDRAKLIEILQNNPELPVKYMAHADYVGEEYRYYVCEFSSVIIDYYYEAEERICIGKDEIIEYFIEQVFEEEEEAKKKAEVKFQEDLDKGKIFKSIIIYIG